MSTISIFEITTLDRRSRIDLGLPLEQWLRDVALLPEIRFHPITAEIARMAGSVEDPLPGDPADRIIAATALCLGASLATVDDRLRRLPQLKTLW